MGFYSSQLRAMIRRNFLIKKASRSNLILEIIFPILVVLLAFILNRMSQTEIFGLESATKPEDVNDFFSKYSTTTMYEPAKPVVGFILPKNNNNDEIIKSIMSNELFNNLNLESKKFNNDEEIRSYVNDYHNNLVASIVFESDDYLSYTIRVNDTSAPDPYTPPISNYAYGRHLTKNNHKTDADKYYGVFAPIQAAVDQAIIRLKTNDQGFSLKVLLGKLAKQVAEYTGSKSTSGTIAAYVSLIFLAPLMMIVTYLVKEKERGIKDGLIMAGVHPTIFWLSWEIIYVAIVLVISIIVTLFFLVTGTLSNVNPLIIFIALLLYGLSCCSFAFFFTTFFRKSRTAGAVVGLIAIALCAFNIALAYFSTIAKIITSCIFSQFAIGSFVYEADQMENRFEKLTFNNLFQTEKTYAGIYLAILLANNIVYFLLAVLLDNFSSGENGRYFFRSKKKASELRKESEVTYEKDIQEDYNAKNNEKCMVEVSRVDKIFQKNVTEIEVEDGEEKEVTKSVDYLAVNDVSFKVYQNEIFALLGHNGAGKTTLLNIMVGLLAASQGDIYFDGMSISSNLYKIRRNFGVCPQSNIIFDDLTVAEHIDIYSGIKNTNVDVDELLKEIDLIDQKDKKASKLSGGQKRKLCIGLAIIGDPKYIFLDEPTTGLDPLSRRKIWDLLLKKKEGRVIFLTTHYMDEADIIADRKLILTEGKIRCLGTSLYLKNHFNMSYDLSVESADKDAVQEIISRHIKDAVYVPTEDSLTKDGLVKIHTWRLPLASTGNFTNLLDELESHSSSGGLVKKFALSMPTLEELFIRLEDEANQNQTTPEIVHRGASEDQVLIQTNEDKLPELRAVNKPSRGSIISTLMEFRLKIFLKNKSFATSAILYPVIIAGFCFFVANSIFNNQVSIYDKKVVSIQEMYPQSYLNYDINQSNVGLTNENFARAMGDSNTTYLTNMDLNAIPLPKFNDDYYISSFNGQNVNNSYVFNINYNDTMTHAIPSTINAISNAILSSKNVTDQIVLKSHPYDLKNKAFSQVALMFATLSVGACIISSINRFGALVVRERLNLLLQQLQISGVYRINYWLSTLISDYSVAVLTCFLIIIAGIIVRFAPLLNVWVCILIFVSILIWCLPTLLYQYIWSFIFDKEEAAYSIMFMINFIPVIFGYIASFILYNVDNVIINIETKNVLYSTATIILNIIITIICPVYGIVTIKNTFYTMRIAESLYKFDLNFGNFFKFNNGFLPIIITLIVLIIVYLPIWVRLDVIKNQISYGEPRKFPTKVQRKYEDVLEEGDEDVRDEARFANKHQDELPISTINFSKEYEYRGKISSGDKQEMKKKGLEEFEYGEVHPSFFNKKLLVKTAVVDVSFGVRSRECFGLLGPNGAGKTTILNALTYTFEPTTGKISFNGRGIHNTPLTELSMGYCPQINILWKELTIREHLELILRIRGYNKKEASDYAIRYINACGLTDHQNKPADKLSGGTKRKLSLLIAICGYSKQILLDEPTAGLDPSSRRYVWNIINDTKKMNETALILTTHSMEEAEQLCDRLAILVNGRLTCIGAPEHLKLKYGEGYALELYSNNIHKFHSEIVEKGKIFGDYEYTMEKTSHNRVKYEVYMTKNLSNVFKIMEDCKAKGLVNDYTFSQASLEQIFIDFAKEQITEVDSSSSEEEN